MANNVNTASPDLDEPLAIQSHTNNDDHHESLELSTTEMLLTDSLSPTISQPMKDKCREWEGSGSQGMPLTLLDLPVDVLRLIVNELIYTNDLIALASTHSALYELAIPSIYSRFDIVWPDASIPAQSSKSVDALSYGLATLCFPSRFAETARRSRGAGIGQSKNSRQLANNNHAKYIRKFSIGDGPTDWTSEYIITKENGKMLGTLVAIAVSKMVNLETFVWDMPTGVLSDVFQALSSLEDDQGRAKLQKVWVRWHDNSSTTPTSTAASSPTTALPPLNPPSQPLQTLPLVTTSNSIGNYVPAHAHGATSQPKGYAQSCVEYPTFSILPPLKSLTVLNIDDLSYLDEMSVLIERSASHLRELQIGISKKACGSHAFTQPWDGANLQQVDHEAKWPGESRIPTTRLGGVLGVLVGRIYDLRRMPSTESHKNPTSEQNVEIATDAKASKLVDEANKAPQSRTAVNEDISDSFLSRKQLEGKLKLEKLALERVTLSIAVCSQAIDWSNMTNLTILSCQHHESLWKALRRQFQPTPLVHDSRQGNSTRYHLSLKHISTDVVSPAFVIFMKESIAPNTMEAVFLQDRQPTPKPSVTLEQIFKSIVKRHRGSLKKLLLDSADKTGQDDAALVEHGRWKHWAVKDEFLSYITSGRMTSLRELGMAIDYRDWHTLLQKLPQMANLRSLYIPRMIIYHAKPLPAPKELALQIVDIISLRRDIQLAYVGLWHKCFEIAEAEVGDNAGTGFPDNDHYSLSGSYADHTDEESESDDETDEDEDDNGNDEPVEEASDDGQSEADSFVGETANRPLPRLRLREILFYEDKVELFRARHGKL